MDEYFEQKDIPGTNGWYQATTDGRIWSCQTSEFLKPWILRNGYKQVQLYRNGKRKGELVHRLVALTWVDEVEGQNEVDHINRNQQDNRFENLRWVNRSQNSHNRAYKGYIFRPKTNKWEASIKINNKTKYLGTFNTEQEARVAYLKAKSELVTF